MSTQNWCYHVTCSPIHVHIYLHVASVSDLLARPTPKPLHPSPPPDDEHKKVSKKPQSSQNVLNKLLKKLPLVRAKTMENILSSSKNEITNGFLQDDYNQISRENSPTFEPVAFKSTPLPLPPSSPESASCGKDLFCVASLSLSLEVEKSPLSSSMDGLLPFRQPPTTRPKALPLRTQPTPQGKYKSPLYSEYRLWNRTCGEKNLMLL